MARSTGWVPNQHGAWAMLAVPALVGSVLLWREAGPRWAMATLIPAWFVGYFAFHAASLWLKSRRKPRYLRPLAVYGAAAALLAVVTLALAPHLLWWGFAFAPLLGIGLWEAHRRRDRSLLSGAVTVLAAGLLVPVLRSLGPDPMTHRTVVVWAALTVYFLGTVLVVKTMIRERGSRAYLALSVGWHAAAAILAGLAALPTLAAFFAVATARAAALPWLAARGRVLRPAQIGMVEIVLSALVAVLVLR